MPPSSKFAFIGFGEVGQTFSRELLATNRITISAWDVLFGANAGDHLTRAAEEIGVAIASSSAQAINGADLVISAVTADQAEAVARQAAGYLRPGQIFFDVNSAAPSTKCRAAKYVEASGAQYVEGAVMAPVLKPGIRVPIFAGGPGAVDAATILNALGMKLTPVSTEHGRASAMKLCRSIVIKGMEALLVQCAAASRHWNIEDDIFSSLAATFPSIDWPKLATEIGERVATHGRRRAAEMEEVAEMLESLGLDPALAQAVAQIQRNNAKSNFDGKSYNNEMGERSCPPIVDNSLPAPV